MILVGAIAARASGQAARTGWTIVACNNLGQHRMDADFSTFPIMPPYNTIQAQVVGPDGRLTTAGIGVTITPTAADPDSHALTYRIASQRSNGTVSLSERTAASHPFDRARRTGLPARHQGHRPGRQRRVP